MDVAPPRNGGNVETGDGEQQGPKNLKMDMKMSGEINIVDPGMPYNAPDVSGAKEMTGTGTGRMAIGEYFL